MVAALVFGTAAILFLLFSAGLTNVWDALTQANVEYIILALVATLVGLFVRGVRRVFFLRAVKCQLRTRDIFLIVLSGAFFENISPARLGEFFVPAVLSAKDKDVGSSMLSSVIVERTLDLATAAGIALVGIFALDLNPQLQTILAVGIVITVALILVIFRLTSIVGTLVHYAAKHLKFFRAERVKNVEASFQSIMQSSKTSISFLMKNKKTAAVGLGFTLLLWSLNGVRLYFVVQALGLGISWLQATVVVVFTILLAIASMIPFGFGTAELAMVFILMSLGAQFVQPKALGVALIDRFLAVWLVVLIGAIASLRIGKLGSKKQQIVLGENACQKPS
jgi:glycosyltransferase 2 family protein